LAEKGTSCGKWFRDQLIHSPRSGRLSSSTHPCLFRRTASVEI
jgi:hypothetical protein